MTKISRVLGHVVTMTAVGIVGAALAGCGSTKAGAAADAGRGGAGGSASITGGLGAGGTIAASGGTPGGSGGLGAGGTAGSGGTTAGSGGLGAGGAGTGGGGIDASPPDAPIGVDSGNGGMASGGRSGPAGGTGAGGTRGGDSSGGRGGTATGGTGAGGVASSGGASGTGGTPCARVPGDDATCAAQHKLGVAYFCQVPARPPSTDCVMYNGIGSGDFLCCPGQYANCPAQRPTAGTGCPTTMLGMNCTYGGDLDPACRTAATCENGTETYPTWQVPAVTCDSSSLPVGCPSKPAAGQACSPHGLSCPYATGDRCECTGCNAEFPSCPITPPDAWYCWAPPQDPCPTASPTVGSACALPADVLCRYRCDLILSCSAQGTWVKGAEACPKCNAPDTPIATPSGNRPIAALAPGDLVYSIHRGQMSVVPIAEVGRQAQRDHHVMRLQLATGVVLHTSPTHPTADGRTMGDLAADDRLDGVRIVSAELVPYRHSHTYDILPASDTGTYYAGGVLVGSTLAPAQRLAAVPSPRCAGGAGR
jgi:hypothetical protein